MDVDAIKPFLFTEIQ